MKLKQLLNKYEPVVYSTTDNTTEYNINNDTLNNSMILTDGIVNKNNNLNTIINNFNFISIIKGGRIKNLIVNSNYNDNMLDSISELLFNGINISNKAH